MGTGNIQSNWIHLATNSVAKFSPQNTKITPGSPFPTFEFDSALVNTAAKDLAKSSVLTLRNMRDTVRDSIGSGDQNKLTIEASVALYLAFYKQLSTAVLTNHPGTLQLGKQNASSLFPTIFQALNNIDSTNHHIDGSFTNKTVNKSLFGLTWGRVQAMQSNGYIEFARLFGYPDTEPRDLLADNRDLLTTLPIQIEKFTPPNQDLEEGIGIACIDGNVSHATFDITADGSKFSERIVHAILGSPSLSGNYQINFSTKTPDVVSDFIKGKYKRDM